MAASTAVRMSHDNETVGPPETPEDVQLQGVAASLPPSFRSSLEQAMSECYDNVLELPYPQDDGKLYCNRTFDGWGCWNDTLAGTRAFILCPVWASDGFDPKLKAFKDCNSDGQWWVHPETNNTWSNYTTCINHEELARQQTVNMIYVIGYSISLVFLLSSLFIFFYFRQLRCVRINIHKQLFMSFIIHNTVWIIHNSSIPNSPVTLLQNGWPCRLFHIFICYSLVCNYFWMFNEGLYLHTVLVFSFAKTEILLKVFYFIGWGLPIAVAITYGVARSYNPLEDKKCWIDAGKYIMVLAVPVVISLLANLIFLCNIVRVLITKMRATNSREDHHTRKAVRATLILVPLLGLQYILFPFRPEGNSAGVNVVFAYDIASAVLTSLQGLFVALIFCFFNGEVIDLTRRDLKVRRESYALNRTRSSMANSSIRSKYHPALTPSPGSMRRPSQFQFHQDSLKMHTPSIGTPSPSPSRRGSQFQFHQDSLKLHTPSPNSNRKSANDFQWSPRTPSPRTYRRTSKIVEEASSQLKSPTTPQNNQPLLPNSCTSNNHVTSYQNHATHVQESSDEETSQVAL